MRKIYSRSYGSIETDARTRPKITVPPDYNGSMYAESKRYEPEIPEHEKEETPAEKEKKEPAEPVSAKPAAPHEKAQGGLLGGLLEKISAEDLIMFGLILAMLLGDSDDNTALLAVIMAIILT